MGAMLFTGGIVGTVPQPEEQGDGQMSADMLARLRSLAMESEVRWRTMAPHEAVRFVYYLQRLHMVIVARATIVGNDVATGCCHNERS
jgi:hypothetical protein